MRPQVFTIPPHRSFADALVAGVMARHGGDPLALAQGVILTPNSRAARAITDAFVRRAERGLLLPRLVPVGDIDLDERLGALLDPIGSVEPVPPAIDPLQRQLILARLIIEAEGRAGNRPGMAEAMRLAAELGRTLDQLHVERIDPARLAALDPGDRLSAHWARALILFELVLTRWPAELARLGRIDLADRRNRLLDHAARRWRDVPPPGFVIAAGISTAAPAVAALLRTIAFSPRGAVVFDALDIAMPRDEWDSLGPHDPDPDTGVRPRAIETHPQYHLKLLLDRMGIGRDEVVRWRWGGGHAARAGRSRLISNALAPAEATVKWTGLPAKERDRAGIRLLEVATPAEEAQAIAIALREALEMPERTAALVTPDRGLAQRVVAHLRRWGIEADDSAGQPLSRTPPGTLLRAIIEAAAEDFAPTALLALLKHPLVRAGEGRAAWLDRVRALDLRLRGPRPAPGLAALGLDAEMTALLAPLAEALAGPLTLGAVVAAVRETAERLAGDAAWARAAGRAAADLLARIEEHAAAGPAAITRDALAPLLADLMDAVAVRPPQGGHPRIFIWGLIEARLQQADLMVLGGLNEGVWPAAPPPDPWLAPRIRADLGLPGLETRIGLAAHGFAGAMGAPQLLITRAARDARGPAVASRLWLRLEALTGGLPRAGHLAGWAARLDRPDRVQPAARPAPRPPAAARPRALSVTDLDRLKADPFAFYAQAMLRLRRIEPVDAEPSPAWRGTMVHDVLEKWSLEDGGDPARLHARAQAMLASLGAHPLLRALWQPRLMAAIDWIAATMAAQMAEGRRVIAVEARGEIETAGITLSGRADRIDRLPDGGLAIIDYKTGAAPNGRTVSAGFAQQLGLIGLMAERGGFAGITGQAVAFDYWSLARNKAGGFGAISSPVDPAGKRGRVRSDAFVAHAAHQLEDAVGRWLTGDQPFTAKLHPERAPYGDYDQLMRLDEWYGRDSGEGAA